MVRFSRFKILTLTFLLFTHSIALATTSGFYVDIKAGAGVEKEEQGPNMPRGEFNLLTQQIKNIIDHGNQDASLKQELWQASKQIFSTPPYAFREFGIGYRFKLMMPFAIEVKGVSGGKKDEWLLFWAGNLKAFLPLGHKTKLYCKIGKYFPLNDDEHLLTSLRSINDETLNNIKENIWETTPKEQWRNSLTSVGVGLVRKLSSRIELELALDGYTTRESDRYYFTFSLEGNYLFE